MYRVAIFAPLVIGFAALVGCQNSIEEVASTGDKGSAQTLVEQTVEASCGQCQFGMEGSGCDLAIRIGDNSYWVDGTGIDDHGDAHGEDGLCNCIRKAIVSGEIKDDRIHVRSFELVAEKNSD